MDSLGVFYDVNLKKSNDIMSTFEQAFIQTNNLMETMDNFHKPKIKKNNFNNDFFESSNDKELKNLIGLRNNFGKKPTKRNFKFKKHNTIRGIKPIYPRANVNNAYNYQNEYENELIQEIEQLFNPNMKNNKENGEKGMLSFLSPLIDSAGKNIQEKNKKFYQGQYNENKNSFKNLNKNKTKPQVDQAENKEEIDNENYYKNGWNNNEYEKNNESNNNPRSYSSDKNNNSKLPLKNIIGRGNGSFFGKKKSQKNNKYNTKYEGFKNNKNILQSELDELKKNRYFNRTRTNYKIVARDISHNSGKNETKIDQLLAQLKKHYS